MMGSPAVSIERLNSSEAITAVADLMEYMGHKSFDAVMGLEIGGANGLEPLLIGSSRNFDRPVVDADWMGTCHSCGLAMPRADNTQAELTRLTGRQH
jgi:DUF917 family protein